MAPFVWILAGFGVVVFFLVALSAPVWVKAVVAALIVVLAAYWLGFIRGVRLALAVLAVLAVVFLLFPPFLDVVILFEALGAVGYALYRAYEQMVKGPSIDQEIISLAKEYGGVLVPDVLVYRLGLTAEEALAALEKFVQLGYARRYYRGVYYYDFPGTRSRLTEVQQRVVEVLRDNPQGVALADLVAAYNEPMESVKQALRDLVDRDIVNEEGGRYKLIFSRVKAVGG